MLLNIGYTYAKKSFCGYMVFHDVDMLPVDVDYSYSDCPLHLATNFTPDDNEIFDERFLSCWSNCEMRVQLPLLSLTSTLSTVRNVTGIE